MTGKEAREKLTKYLLGLAKGHNLEIKLITNDLVVEVQQPIGLPSVFRPFLTKEAIHGGVLISNDKYRKAFSPEDAPDDLLMQLLEQLDVVERRFDYEIKYLEEMAESRIAAARRVDEKIIEVMEEKYVPGWTDSEGEAVQEAEPSKD